MIVSVMARGAAPAVEGLAVPAPGGAAEADHGLLDKGGPGEAQRRPLRRRVQLRGEVHPLRLDALLRGANAM